MSKSYEVGKLGQIVTVNVNTGILTFGSTGAVIVPSGTTAQRPSAANGIIRYNTNTTTLETYSTAFGWGGLLTGYSDVRQQFTASNNQTTFTVNYLSGQVDVFYNGIKLRNGVEVDISSGTSVVLSTGAANGALIEVVGKGPSYLVSNTSQVVYQQFTANATQTTFPVSGGYVPGMVDVFVEGVKLVSGTDVNISSGINVVLANTVPNNSIVEVRGITTPVNPSTTAAVRQTFTANSTVNNNFTVTGGYIPGFVDVYYNGTKLVNGSDVNVSSGTSIVLASNAALNAIVDVVGINYYTNAGSLTTPVRQSFTASSNQTTFTINGGYTPGMICVYQNGVRLVNGADVNVSSGTSVVLATGAANNDTLDVVGFSAVSYQDAVKKSGDSMTGPLSLPIGGLTVGTNQVVVAANGNVGINDASPASGRLVITGSAVTTSQGIRLNGDSLDTRLVAESATMGAAVLGTFSNHSLKFYTNSTEKANIDSTGRMTLPFQPRMHASRYVSDAWVTFSSQIVTLNNVYVNVGNCYNSSTGYFTCPVAGYYSVTVGALVGQGGGYGYARVAKNGTVYGASFHGNGNGTNLWYTINGTVVVYCAVNDTLALWLNGGTNSFYNGGDYSFMTIEFVG